MLNRLKLSVRQSHVSFVNHRLSGRVLVAVLLASATARERVLQIPVHDTMMVPLAANVFAEPGLTEAESRELLAAHAVAVTTVRRFFGELRKDEPITLFCRSAACKVTFGAPPAVAGSRELGFARDGLQTSEGFLATPVVVASGPFFNTSRILTHEFVHAEMKAWVSYDSLPTWFNEGLATWVAGEPDCRSNPPVSAFDIRQLDTKVKWQNHIGRPGTTLRTYCQARAEVSVWAERYPDVASAGVATTELLRAVAAGKTFERGELESLRSSARR